MKETDKPETEERKEGRRERSSKEGRKEVRRIFF